MTTYLPPKGVCANHFPKDVENGVIQSVKIDGGCPGNTVGVSRLLKGMKVEDAIARLEGIRCRVKPTSCPDQVAQALKTVL